MQQWQWLNPYSLSGKAWEIWLKKPDIRDEEMAFLLNIDLPTVNAIRRELAESKRPVCAVDYGTTAQNSAC